MLLGVVFCLDFHFFFPSLVRLSMFFLYFILFYFTAWTLVIERHLNLKTKEDKYGQHGFSRFALKGSSLLYNAKNKNKKPFYEPSYNFTTLKKLESVSVVGRLLTNQCCAIRPFQENLGSLGFFLLFPRFFGSKFEHGSLHF